MLTVRRTWWRGLVVRAKRTGLDMEEALLPSKLFRHGRASIKWHGGGARGVRRRLAGGVLLAFVAGTITARASGILSVGGGGIAPVQSSISGSLAAAQQAQSTAAQAQTSLSRITLALTAMQNIQNTARTIAAAAPSTVPDGLRTGGLVPDSGLAAPGVANPVVDWTGAQTPTQTSAAGKTNVTINQTAAQALLSWNSFNVGVNTTVDFNQHGNTGWVALNRIAPSGVPSQILGSIRASGQVYLINQNGIIFGGASQINVASLIASSADISDSQFLANGIYSTEAGSTYTKSFAGAGGAIVVQPGALISTAAPSTVTTGGGFVMLLGTQVQNGGTISTPDGQTELAAGDDFYIRPGFGTASNAISTTRGNEISVGLNTKGSSLAPGGSGLVVNSGMITADTGDITLAGETVDQNGVLEATTSVAVRGTIHLLSSASDPFSSVTLGNNSTTVINPDLSSTATELDSQRAALIASSAVANSQRISQANPLHYFDDISLLPDEQDESRIDIVTGGTAEFAGNSDTVAAGGQIDVSAAGRVQADSGATVDVSGSYGVMLPMSANDIPVNIQSYELRDNPQNRLTKLLSDNTVYVDDRLLSLVPASAADPSNRDYTEGGVLEVSGYLARSLHTIGEYTALGGTIDLSTGATGAIVTQTGSTFSVAGGSLAYQGGYLRQSYLISSDGEIYNVNNAPAYLTYTGVYDGFEVDHSRWGVTQTYGNVLTDPAEIYQAGYTVGRDAGTLTLSSPTAIFDGTIEAGVVNGAAQTNAAPAGVTDPYTLPQNVVAEPGGLTIGTLIGANLFPSNSNVAFNAAPQNAAGGAGTPIPTKLAGTSIFNAASINNFGLGALQIVTNGSLDISAPLTLAPGGQFGLFGSSVDIGADLTASGGAVVASELANVGGTILTLQAPNPPAGGSRTGDTIVAPGVTISTAGLWTNLAVDPSITFTQAFINGGAVNLQSANNLTLGAGSLVDASAGAVIAVNGAAKGGAGGAISLAAAAPSSTDPLPSGNLTLGGMLRSIGFSKGGALTLAAPSFLISDAARMMLDPATVLLDAAFFTQGFSAYNLNSTGNIAVDPGTTVNVVEPTYQFTDASALLPTGADPAAGYSMLLNPVYIANPALTGITQRAGASFSATAALNLGEPLTNQPSLTIGDGASITVDPGQNIHLQAQGQMTIDGNLTAPGGSIAIVDTFNTFAALPAGPGGVSIWIGPHSVINANGAAFTASASDGAAISVAPAGGKITLGEANSTASVIIRDGALVEASGASAVVETAPRSGLATGLASALPPGQAIDVHGAGGAISLVSEEGIYNDGTLIAAAGGPDAAGGSLYMQLEADTVLNASGFEAAPRVFTISENDPGALLPTGLMPGESDPALIAGTARISAAQISAGGFGSVALFSRDAFVFQGDVTLNAAQSISLLEGNVTDSSSTDSVTLNAPYVLLSGQTPETNGKNNEPLAVITGFSAQMATGTFTVNASLLDLANRIRFGGILPAAQNGGTAADLAGFGTVNLNSTGALRFTPASSVLNGSFTDLVTQANLKLTASEVYASNTGALVVAGYDPAGNPGNGGFYSNGTLTISNTGAEPAVAPDTLGGSLTFEAATINQGGTVWQPLGQITFGVITSFIGDGLAGGGDSNTAVNFLPGSLSTVSAAGLTIPYGGTTDGVTYSANGAPVLSSTAISFGLPGVAHGVAPGTISIAALTTDVEQGATLDLNGGGTLAGEGFISGAGGSTDVLTNPLLNIGPGGITQPTLGTDPVYAIVAGPQQVQAEVVTQSGATGSTPALGAQIVIPAGVPGLPAGTYTLLPAAYALTPGGYRVEFDGAASLAAPSVAPLPNGSYAVAGFTAIANTNVQSSLASNLTITPAATVRNYAQYDEENYSQFLVATAARLGAIRPVLPADAGTLVLTLPALSNTSLINAGLAEFQPAAGGEGGTLQIAGPQFVAKPSLDIYGAAPTPDLPAGTVSLSAAAIDAFHPFILELGIAGAGFNANVNGVTLEDGATLTAARVLITTLTGGITLDSGSEINTLGQGTLLADSSNFGLFANGGASVLDVGNGYLSYSTVPPAFGGAYGAITVQDGTKIYTDGSIAVSTSAAVDISVNASYGGKYLDLDVPEINIGDPQNATVPAGLLLTQAVLQSLTTGDAAIGLPGVQVVVLTATDSLNFYGTTALDLTGQNVQLVINTPAIYGFGAVGDIAKVSAGTIVWNGISTIDPQTGNIVSSLPGGTVTNGPGSGQGTLDFDAGTIILGNSSLDVPQRDVTLNRVTDGFATVNLNATNEITANNQGTLAVYQSQANFGQAGTGGALNLNTPLLTAGNAAVVGFTAGGAITVGPPAGTVAATTLANETAGGEIDLTGGDVNIDGAIILPSGKLNVMAANDISLSATSLINLAGVSTTIVDKTVHGFGGDVLLQSAGGNITQKAGSVIDVAATGNDAGSVSITATDPAAGQVALNGTLLGGASGGYNTASFNIRAQNLGDFAALNKALDLGQFFQARSFDIGQGDLTVGNGVQAHQVTISVDGGSLTVDGLIDASGGGGGSITLAASKNLMLASSAVLDAAGKMLQVDSYGVPIPATNAPTVNLTTVNGELTLAPGVTIDLASADAVARGDLELNVPRLGSATSGDANIAIDGSVGISGASTIAVNAFSIYHGMTDTAGTVTGNPDALITQAYLDQINQNDTLPFMQNAAGNADLNSRLGVLRTTYAPVFHLRPGVEIVSATPDGDLTVQGDINLAGYRYGPGVQTGNYGSGEPGVLLIRAGGDLNIYGSITDGFEQPASDAGTEFAKGWEVFGGGEPYGQNQTLPTSISIAKGSSLAANGATVNFPVPITGGTFQAGAVAPVTLTTSAAQTTKVAFVATSDITLKGGMVISKGTVVPAGTVIPTGSKIAAGGSLPFAVQVGEVTWPANTPFTVITNIPGGVSGVLVASDVTLAAGALIPANSELKFLKGQAGLTDPTDPNGHALHFANGKPVPATVQTRPVGTDGSQGQLYALAALLPAGYLSWSINLVAGANTAAADPTTVQSSSALAKAGVAGDLTLADTHYGTDVALRTVPPRHDPTDPKNHKICKSNPASCQPTYAVKSATLVPAFSVIRTGTGALDLAAGGSINEKSAYGVYTAGAQSDPILDAGQNPYDLPQGQDASDGSLLGPSNASLAPLAADYSANYPTGGGNVLLAAQGNLAGFISTTATTNNTGFRSTSLPDTDAIGSWLWRQGGPGQAAAWWTEFGALQLSPKSRASDPDTAELIGFQGIGTLGGGNLTVAAGGDASGLDLVVGSNGRVQANGTLVQDGGGNLDVNIGGAVNFRAPGTRDPYVQDAGGVISDLRGNTDLHVGSIGNILPVYGAEAVAQAQLIDPRFVPPLASEVSTEENGIDLLPGDGTVNIASRGDLVIDGAGNPGTVQNTVNTTPVDFVDSNGRTVNRAYGGATDFSLWSAATDIGLFSAGGDVAPAETAAHNTIIQNAETGVYPAKLSAIAQNGNIDFGKGASVELAPSASGQLQLLAANSILGNATNVSISGAPLTTVATPFDPGFRVLSQIGGDLLYTNYNPDSPSVVSGPGLLIDFGADTPTGALHGADPQPALVYAGTGDIIDVQFGKYAAAVNNMPLQLIAAEPFDIVAGRDIVASGSTASPDAFLNLSPNDVTSITAGRDIIESSFDIAGPGNLVVQAGRDVYQADQGSIYSIGPVFDIDPNDRNSGAGIAVLAGAGAAGPDYGSFANLYLNPASTLSLENASLIIAADDAELYAWLQSSYGYTGAAADAYGYFQTLSAPQQDIFLRQIYFQELNQSGLEFNDPSSVRYKSYLRGQDAIATLFPSVDASGQALTYTGDITLYGGSGIHTDFGGGIQVLTPGGQTVIGVEGASPPSSAGFITQGSGDIDIYAQGNVLLGESRVLTTFGGNILIWTADGNINAGRGSKTTIDFTPLQRVYDNYGNVFLSPTVPSSGAGIATLNPIPAVPPGNINLVAPAGTVDAGEAGIRVSGNLNIAAHLVVGAGNITVQGSSTGVPTTAAPNIGALTAASNSSAAAQSVGSEATNKPAPLPSIWIVEILGYGGGDDGDNPPPKRGRKAAHGARVTA